MPTNTNQNTPYRDRYKEACFKDAYGLYAVIEVTNFLEPDGNWKQAVLRFNHKGSVFALIENFKAGADNSTDYVSYERDGKEEKRFDTYYEAELHIVDEMRKI